MKVCISTEAAKVVSAIWFNHQADTSVPDVEARLFALRSQLLVVQFSAMVRTYAKKFTCRRKS